MFLREQWGDAPLGSNQTRFYQQALALPNYDFPSLAGLVGLDAMTALDRWSLAEATDDLVAPDVATARGLPQLRTWVPQDREPPFQVSRTANATYQVAVARGSYAAFYLFATGDRGISVTLFVVLRAKPRPRAARDTVDPSVRNAATVQSRTALCSGNGPRPGQMHGGHDGWC